MTMTPQELERKVRQLDNDVQSIYKMVAETTIQQRRMLSRMDEMDARLSGRLDGVGSRLDGVESRLDRLEGKVDTMDGKLDQVLERLTDR